MYLLFFVLSIHGQLIQGWLPMDSLKSCKESEAAFVEMFLAPTPETGLPFADFLKMKCLKNEGAP